MSCLMIYIGLFLSNKLVEARRQVEVKSKHFEDLTASMGDERTDTWSMMDTKPTIVDGEVVSVYRLKAVKSTSS